jgi:hypothetical protein
VPGYYSFGKEIVDFKLDSIRKHDVNCGSFNVYFLFHLFEGGTGAGF